MVSFAWWGETLATEASCTLAMLGSMEHSVGF